MCEPLLSLTRSRPSSGLAFFYGGMVQHKNVVGTIMQVFVALSVIPILWYTIG